MGGWSRSHSVKNLWETDIREDLAEKKIKPDWLEGEHDPG
jgi:hypothetical protein